MFYYKRTRKDVRNYVRSCVVCQICKPLLQQTAGALQPLPIPEAIWVDISLDFAEGLTKSTGRDTILLVMDRLIKYAHFLTLSHPFTVARLLKYTLSKFSNSMVFLRLLSVTEIGSS